MHSNFMGSDSEKDKHPENSVKESAEQRKNRRRGRRGKRAAVEVPSVTIEGNSIDEAVQKALDNDPTTPDSATEYILEHGPEISIDDLPEELRDEVDLEQQFYEMEHGMHSGPLPDAIDQPDDPTPVNNIAGQAANNTPTVPAPAFASPSPILPGPLPDHEVDLDGLDDEEPKAGIFQLPKNFNPAPEIIAATQAAAAAQIGLLPPPSVKQSPIDPSLHEKKTLAPPPKDQLPLLGDIVVDYGEEKDEITRDLSQHAEFFWSFRESRFCDQYDSDMVYYKEHCLKDPHLIRPNVEDYLNRFRAELEKNKSK